MKIYIDLIILINSIYDYLILTSVSIILKRNTKLKRIIYGTLIGNISLIFLFINIDKYLMLLYKIFISFIMVKITFNDKLFLEEMFYMFVVTVLIGGSQILISGSYYKINIIYMLLVSIPIIYLYIKSMKKYNLSINKLYQVVLVNNSNVYNLTGFIDTGNTLVDPLTNLPVIIVNNKYKFSSNKFYYVPVNTINNSSILKCIKIDNIIINNKIINALIGTTDKIKFNKYDVILNDKIREILYD